MGVLALSGDNKMRDFATSFFLRAPAPARARARDRNRKERRIDHEHEHEHEHEHDYEVEDRALLSSFISALSG